MFGDRHLFHFLLQEVLYFLELRLVLFRYQRDGASAGSCPGRTTNAVHIVFGIVGDVEIYDQRDVVNVYSSCHDVRGHENVRLSATEQIHHLVAFLLRKVAMHGTAVELGSGQ